MANPFQLEKSRIELLRLVFALAVLAVAGRVFTQSVLQHANFVALSQKQHLVQKDVLPKRGTIYAQNSGELQPLALSVERYDVLVVPRNIKDKHLVARELAAQFSLKEDDIYNQINNDKPYLPPLTKSIDKSQADALNRKDLVGVYVTPVYTRFYPEHNGASQVVGFVNSDGQGNYGLEGYYDSIINGYKGSVTAEKDNKGRYITIQNEQAAQNGSSLVTTIDINVQYKAQQLIEQAVADYRAQSGQLIVLDPKTGGVLALAATPTYDPNGYADAVQKIIDDNKNIKDPKEQKDPLSIFLNPLISQVYEPGSIIKPLVVTAGLDTDKFKPDTEAGTFGASVTVQGYEIHTAQNKAFGKENITDVLIHSDNVAMVSIANQLGNDLINQYFSAFGLGTKTSIDLAGETSGTVAAAKDWRDINRATMAFGQGLSVTPLQIATAYLAIARGGELVQPHIVQKIVDSTGKEKAVETKTIRRVMKPETAAMLKVMLQAVVDKGYENSVKLPDYTLAGKTGTAQIPDPNGGYLKDDFVHSFAGFGPVGDPRFVILVKLDRPKGVQFAGSSAGPTFQKMAKYLFNYLQIPKS